MEQARGARWHGGVWVVWRNLELGLVYLPMEAATNDFFPPLKWRTSARDNLF